MNTIINSGGGSKNYLYNEGEMSPLITLSGNFVNEGGAIQNTGAGAQTFTIDQSVLSQEGFLILETTYSDTSGTNGILYIRLRQNGSTVKSTSQNPETGTSLYVKALIGIALTNTGVNQIVIEYTGYSRTMKITKIYVEK